MRAITFPSSGMKSLLYTTLISRRDYCSQMEKRETDYYLRDVWDDIRNTVESVMKPLQDQPSNNVVTIDDDYIAVLKKTVTWRIDYIWAFEKSKTDPDFPSMNTILRNLNELYGVLLDAVEES